MTMHGMAPRRIGLAAGVLVAIFMAGCTSLQTATPTPALPIAQISPGGEHAPAVTILPDPLLAAGVAAERPVDNAPAAVISGEPPKLDRAIIDAYVPQPVQQPLPQPVRPRGRLDPGDDGLRGDLWQRLRKGFALPPFQNDLVTKWEQWYGSRPDYVQRMTERGGRYLFYILEEIERRGMPSDLALLPFIESAFNPQAVSSARASGMWQFMPATGRDFELRQNLFRDDRRDVLESTRAALDYLQRLATMFGGDWHLALAAYNWGQGNVQKAIARNRAAGQPAGYEDLRMPDETRNYVPKLQAVKNIVAQPQAYGLTLPALDDRSNATSTWCLPPGWPKYHWTTSTSSTRR